MHGKSEEGIPYEHHIYRVGDWLPGDHRVHKAWLSGVIDHVDKNPKDLHPVLKEFQDLIENDSRVYCLISSMFEQIPTKKPYARDPTGAKQVRDYPHMLRLLNHLMTTAPHWNDKSEKVGFVGVPINAVLDWPMGTPSGFAVFTDPDINAMWKKVLDAWGEFLQSEESAKQALGKDASGWLGTTALSGMTDVSNKAAGQSYSFEDIFECDPCKLYHGFRSWDGFFTRTFREGVRPLACPDDDNAIANACESKPYNYQYDCNLRDRFWIKGQPYSVLDMLAHDDLAPLFDGCTVYQAFLSALSYHRWHAPVSGKIAKAYVKAGTYYSEPLFTGIGDPANRSSDGIDIDGEVTGQGYLTSSATRAVIFIEADNPAIGLMAFLGVGMGEVSTCDITVKEGQHVRKGDEIGMFHFGGSTHCLMFRKGVDVQGFPEPSRDENVPVRSLVGVVVNGK